MKKNIWMMAGCMTALVIATTGCNNDELAETQENGKFTITAGTPTGADTRLDLTDERNNLKITWHTPGEPDIYGSPYTDEFSVFTGDGAQTPTTFNVTALGTDSHNATCEVKSGSSFATPADGTKLYAFIQGAYGVSNGTHDPAAISLNIARQPGGKDSICYERQLFMHATATSDGTDNINLSFKHVNAVVKLVLLFSDADPDRSIYDVGLSSPNMHNKATLNLTNGQITYSDADKGGITIENYYDLNPNKQLTSWITVFPEALTDVKVVAKTSVYSSGAMIITNYEGTLSDITLEAGKMYTATATLTKKP